MSSVLSNATLVVLAGGASRRFGSLKQTTPIGPHGETLLEYGLYDACRSGFGDFVVVLKSDIEDEFRRTVGHRIEKRLDVKYVCQDVVAREAGEFREKPWGTAHALLCAMPLIEKPFAVINSDDFYGQNSFRSLGDYLQSDDRTPVLVGFPLLNTISEHGTVTRGILRLSDDGSLEGVDETFHVHEVNGKIVSGEPGSKTSPIPADALASMNMWGFGKEIANALPESWTAFLAEHGDDADAEFFIPDVVTSMIRNDGVKVAVRRTNEQWVGLTHPGDLSMATRAIRSMIDCDIYPEFLWADL